MRVVAPRLNLLNLRSVLLAAALLVLALTPVEKARRDTFSILGEFTPSTSVERGARIERLSFAQKTFFTRAVMSDVPLADVGRLFALGDDDLAWSYRSGGYQQSMAPNLFVTIAGAAADEERVSAFSMAWMYVYQQDAVPYFTASREGQQAVRLSFREPLSEDREAAMFVQLMRALGKDAGYTRMGEREILVIDTADSASFVRRVEAFTASVAASNPVEAEHFRVHSIFWSHDWKADPTGEALLAQICARFPAAGLESALRRLRARYERAVGIWLALKDSPSAERSQSTHAPLTPGGA